ncbi:hypothetical protein [Odoribacter lunatus]|uniref:hypothetical protein n=1 Tax=Odoribacter lunatus TaxID=2941335 RepID=UPI00203CB9B1|nr:hypothetical protein [Odoribacter lunatus]
MFILKLLLIFSLFIPDGNELWKRTETEEHISFLFPNAVQSLTQETNGIRSRIYQTKDLTCVFGVVCSDFSNSPLPITDETAPIIYEQMRQASVGMETAILKDEKTVPYDNMLIKEIEYSILKDNYEMTYFKRFIFRDNMVYQLSVGGRSRHREYILKAREIFFNSIQFH